MSEPLLSSLFAAIGAAVGGRNRAPWLTGELKQMLDIVPAFVFVAEDAVCAALHGNAAAMALQDRKFEAFDADGVRLAPDQFPVRRAARGEAVSDMQFELRFADGGSVFLHGAANELRDENGAIRGAIGVFTDITALKKREREPQSESAGRRSARIAGDAPRKAAPSWFGACIDCEDRGGAYFAQRQNDELFRTIFENAAIGMAIAEGVPDGVFLRTNDRLCEMLGYGPGELAGRSFTDITHPDDRGLNGEKVRAILAGELANYTMEKRYLRRDGAPLWVSVTMALIRDREHKPTFFIGSMLDITDRKRAEETLHRSEEHLRLAMKGSQAGAWQWNLATDETIWSPETFRLYERDPQLGPPHHDVWWTFVHPDDREPVARAIRDARESQAPENRMEFRVILPSGGIRWIEALTGFEYAADGTPQRMFGISLNITERKRAENDLKEREIRRSFSEEGGGVGAWDWDIATNSLRWSEVQCALFGIDPAKRDAIPFEDWLATVHPDDRAGQIEALQKSLASGGNDPDPEAAYRIIKPDGVHWINARGRVQRDATGKGVRMFGVTLDITERKLAEQRLSESEARFRAAQEASLDGFLIYEPVADESGRVQDLRVIYANPIAAKAHDVSPEQMKGRLIGDLLPNMKAPGGFIERVRPIIESGKSEEFIFDYDDGNAIVGNYRNLIVPFGRYAATTVRDVTELVRDAEALSLAKAEAERANLAKSKFLAAASHDLRQPVQSMTLMMAAIKLQVSDRPRVAAAVDTVEASIKSLNRMLSGILDISRLEAGVIQPVVAGVDLGEIISGLMREYAPCAAKAGLALRCRPRALRARTDAALLERILRNLVENALRYTVEGGVLVGLRQRGDKVRIDVIDTGIGIPADQQGEIFEDYRQLNNPARDSSHGLGLGLAIVSRLARLLGAQVQVFSRVGRGTRFSLLLPLERTAPVPVESKTAPDDPGGRILIIEDDEAVRESYETLLELLGYTTVSADTGEKALAVAEREGWRFDAILADHRLGAGLTGTETAAEISRRAGRALPTVVVTGDTARERLVDVSASGFAMLHKPVEADELSKTLASLLSGA